MIRRRRLQSMQHAADDANGGHTTRGRVTRGGGGCLGATSCAVGARRGRTEEGKHSPFAVFVFTSMALELATW